MLCLKKKFAFTDAEGNTPKTRWMVHLRKDTPNGGPVHWLHENYVCPNCVATPNDSCCQNVQPGNFCNADSPDISTDSDVIPE